MYHADADWADADWNGGSDGQQCERRRFRYCRWFDVWSHVELAKSLTVPPKWSKPYAKQARVHVLELVASIAMGRGDWQTTFARLNTLRDSQRANFARHLDLAAASIEIDETAKAIEVCKEFASINEKNSAGLLLAKVYLKAGRDEEAQNWYVNASNAENASANTALLEHGFLLLNQNRPEEAIEKANLVGSGSVESLYLRALCHRMNGDFEPAELQLSKLHQAEPASFRYGNHLALVLIESSDESKRARALQIATANFGRINSAETLSTLGWVRYRLGEMKLASDLLSRAIQMPSAGRDTFPYLATIKLGNGKTDTAHQLQAISDSMDGPRYHQP